MIRGGVAGLFAGLLVARAFASGPVGSPWPGPTPGGAPSIGPCRASLPELPRLLVDTKLAPPTGRALAVPEGGDLQTALDQAAPGDVIELAPGATYVGPFHLRSKGGIGWIIVRAGTSDEGLPPPGDRLDPARALSLPKLEAAASSVLVAEPRAHHFRFIGLEMRPRSGSYLTNLVQLGSDERSEDQLPHHIIIDRCYLHGDPQRGTRRGVALNGRDIAIIDSTLADFKEVGADSQAIAGWNGTGPFLIRNNDLEGAGENVIFGGSTPSIRRLVPSDIVIEDNTFSKPLSWKSDEPDYAGTPWTIKNLFELKNARRVLVEHNRFQNSWVQAQRGFAMLLTVRTEMETAPWAVIEDVVIRNNRVRRCAGGVNLLGMDDSLPRGSGHTRRVAIVNNLFEEIGGARWGGGGILFQILNGVGDLLIEHTTALQTGHIIAADLRPSPGFIFRDNIALHNQYGIFGSGSGSGLPAIAAYFPEAVIVKNVIIGVPEGVRYPAENFFPASLDDVGFVAAATGVYQLSAGSRYHGAATDGRDLGVDVTALPPPGEEAP